MLARFAAHCIIGAISFSLFTQSSLAEARWYKGNLHTHSFWSDGDTFPELIADWYKKNGYDFLAFSDHNTLHEGEKWVAISDAKETTKIALSKYTERFGAKWVEQRKENGTNFVRVKRFKEYQ